MGEIKKWSKPELTVLVRSNPEEAVLTFCKVSTEMGPMAVEYATCDYAGGEPCLEAHPS